MNRGRIRTISLVGLLAVAVGRARLLRLDPSTAQFGERLWLRPPCLKWPKSIHLLRQLRVQPSQDGAIFVPPEKQQLIGMRSVPAEMGTLTKEIRIVGKVTYDETHLTHIHSKVSGYIEEVFADSVGKPVRAGDPLFTIYSPDLLATQQDFLLALKSRDLLRNSTVASAAVGSENLIAAARERLRLWDVSDQEIQSLETDGKVKRAIAVYSPVTGIVMERAAYHHGTFVDPTKDLFTIVDLSHVWILGEVYETDLPFVRTGPARSRRASLLRRRAKTQRARRIHLSVPRSEDSHGASTNGVRKPRSLFEAGDVHEYHHVRGSWQAGTDSAGRSHGYRYRTIRVRRQGQRLRPAA